MHVVYFFQNKKGHVFTGRGLRIVEGVEENPGRQGNVCVVRVESTGVLPVRSCSNGLADNGIFVSVTAAVSPVEQQAAWGVGRGVMVSGIGGVDNIIDDKRGLVEAGIVGGILLDKAM